MIINDSYVFDQFHGIVKNYIIEVIAAIEQFIQLQGDIVPNIKKCNYLDNTKHNYIMNIIETYPVVNNHYAFFYLSMDEESFLYLSEIVCKSNGIPCDNDTIRHSGVKECCNRIGAKLLKYIKKDGSKFDIGTPSALPIGHLISQNNEIREWPFSFYSIDFEIGGHQFEFGSTVLESPEKRVEQIFDSIKSFMQKRKDVKINNEEIAARISSLFSIHFSIKLITGERVILSFTKEYIANALFIVDGVMPQKDEVKSLIAKKIQQINNVETHSIVENTFPFISGKSVSRIVEICDQHNNAKVGITVSVQNNK